jgi:hypothetical protein
MGPRQQPRHAHPPELTDRRNPPRVRFPPPPLSRLARFARAGTLRARASRCAFHSLGKRPGWPARGLRLRRPWAAPRVGQRNGGDPRARRQSSFGVGRRPRQPEAAGDQRLHAAQDVDLVVPEVVEVRVQRGVQQPELVVGELDRVSHGRNLTRGAGCLERISVGPDTRHGDVTDVSLRPARDRGRLWRPRLPR